jgi:hypothetical protein
MIRFWSFLVFLLVLACSCSKPGPEETLHQFKQAIAEANWELAKELSVDNAQTMLVQGCIDAGCEPYSLIIYDISCEIFDGISANCKCQEGIEGGLPMRWTQEYHLEKRNEEWKVTNLGDVWTNS